MKKYIFVFLFLSAFNLYAQYFSLDLISKTGFTFDYSKENDIEKARFDDISHGFKLITPINDIRFYKKADLSTFGYSFFTSNFTKKLPITIKIGNLSKSGGYSKLRNPFLSASISSFSIPSINISPITAYLPSYSSFSNPFSSFCQISIKSKSIFKELFFNFLREEDQTTTFSTGFKIDFNKKVNFSFNSVVGNFPYSENTSSTWFSSDKYFSSGNHFCFLSQILFSTPHFSTIFSINGYESPFGYYHFIYKSENKIKTKNLDLGFSVFYNDNDNVLTPSETYLNSALQSRLTIIFHTPIKIKKIILLKIGLCGYLKLNLSEYEHDFFYSGGFQFSSDKSNLCINIKCENDFHVKNYFYTFTFNKIEVKISENLYLTKLNPTVSLTFIYKPQNDSDEFSTSQNLSLSFSIPKNPSLSINTQCYFLQKNYSLDSSYFSSSISYKMNISKLNITFKTSFKFIFL